MLKVGYVGNYRIHIDDYNPILHENKVQCEEGHFLIAKRGAVRDSHFCHKAGEGNGSCSKGTGTWHLWWQNRLLPQNIEFRFTKYDNNGSKILKIADIINVIGQYKDTLSIVELQNSKMSEEEMAFREAFYTRPDLLSEWGLPKCKATLTWVFNLNDCDIQIDHIFGDVVCFRWIKGSKYMLAAKARTFMDQGRRDLLEIIHIHKPKIVETQFIARIMSLETFDKLFFDGILDTPNKVHNELSLDQKRLNTNKLAEYNVIASDEKRTRVVEMAMSFYFKTTGAKSSGSKSKTNKNNTQNKKITKEDIDRFISE
jgi:hypothetical protein